MKSLLLTAAALAGVLTSSGCAAGSSDSEATSTGEASTPAAAPAADASVAPSSAPSTSSSGASSVAAPSSSAPDAAAQPSAPAAASTEGKVHFTGDYTKTIAADSDRILELSRQWHSPEREAALRAKMASAGLSSNISADVAGEWYSRPPRPARHALAATP